MPEQPRILELYRQTDSPSRLSRLALENILSEATTIESTLSDSIISRINYELMLRKGNGN